MAYKVIERHSDPQKGVHYFYFGRNLWRSHHGVLTAGAVVSPPSSGDPADPKEVTVAFAFCSPKDEFARYTELREDTKYDKTEKCYKRTLVKGGINIVNARLGLVPMDGIYRKTVRVPLRGSVLQAVLDAFNTLTPKIDKPQLWQRRVLIMAPRQALYRLAMWTDREALELADLTYPDRIEPGFTPLLKHRTAKAANRGRKPAKG